MWLLEGILGFLSLAARQQRALTAAAGHSTRFVRSKSNLMILDKAQNLTLSQFWKTLEFYDKLVSASTRSIKPTARLGQ